MQQLKAICPFCRCSKIHLPELSAFVYKTACLYCGRPIRFVQGRVTVNSVPDSPACVTAGSRHYWFPMKNKLPLPTGTSVTVILPFNGLGEDIPLSVLPEGRNQIMLRHIQAADPRDVLLALLGTVAFFYGVSKIAPTLSLAALLVVLGLGVMWAMSEKRRKRPNIPALQVENRLRLTLSQIDEARAVAINRLQSAEQMKDRLTLMQGQATQLNQADFLHLIARSLQQVGDYCNLLQQLISVLEKRHSFCDLELSAHQMAETLPVDSLEWREQLAKQQDFLASELEAFNPELLENYHAISTRTI